MPTVKLVGRPSLNFCGKYLCEIARNLRLRGSGRVIVKESEVNAYSEPCFYAIKRIDPLMSDDSNVRCRAYAERVFRGRNFGVIAVPNSHEPDWRLLSIKDGNRLQEMVKQNTSAAPDVPFKCIAPMPPVLAVKLQRTRRMPQQTIEAARKVDCSLKTESACEGNGFLLLTKLFDDPTAFQVPIEPTKEEQDRIFPEYNSQVAKPGPDGLVRRKDSDTRRDIYYIRRGDSPGLCWRVELAEKDVEDELLLSEC